MKPIRLSKHSLQRAEMRGATLAEIVQCIQGSIPFPAKEGKSGTRMVFPFNAISPVNGKHYQSKMIEAIFSEEDEEVIVITVKVFYFNPGSEQ